MFSNLIIIQLLIYKTNNSATTYTTMPENSIRKWCMTESGGGMVKEKEIWYEVKYGERVDCSNKGGDGGGSGDGCDEDTLNEIIIVRITEHKSSI